MPGWGLPPLQPGGRGTTAEHTTPPVVPPPMYLGSEGGPAKTGALVRGPPQGQCPNPYPPRATPTSLPFQRPHGSARQPSPIDLRTAPRALAPNLAPNSTDWGTPNRARRTSICTEPQRNPLDRTVWTVHSGLLIRRFWVRIPGGAPQTCRSEAAVDARSSGSPGRKFGANGAIDRLIDTPIDCAGGAGRGPV